MSKQKTFWATFYENKIRHLWRLERDGSVTSSCGLSVQGLGLGLESKGDKCKNCLRAIKN